MYTHDRSTDQPTDRRKYTTWWERERVVDEIMNACQNVSLSFVVMECKPTRLMPNVVCKHVLYIAIYRLCIVLCTVYTVQYTHIVAENERKNNNNINKNNQMVCIHPQKD